MVSTTLYSTPVGRSNIEQSGTQRKVLSRITSFLNVPPMHKNGKVDKFSAARVLTSEQCLAIREEKERSVRTKKLRKEVEREKQHIREAEKQRK